MPRRFAAAFGIALVVSALSHCSSRGGADAGTVSASEARRPNADSAPMTGDPLAELRAALHRVRSARSNEHVTVGPLEASMLVGMTRDEIAQALGEPGQCQVVLMTTCDPNTEPVECREEMRAQPAPCQSATDVFYSFYHLPEGSVGGGPELFLRFEGDRCAAAEWMFTQ